MKDPDSLWRDICKRIAEQSRCQSRKVGCILIKNNHLIGEGWNSAPHGSDTKSCTRCNEGCKSGERLDDAICAHAESNAIGYCARHGIDTLGATAYCTLICCKHCAALLIASGIQEFIYMEDYPGHEQTLKILQNAGVQVRKLDGIISP